MKLTGTPVISAVDSRGQGCHLTQSSGQSIIDSTSPELLLWDTETWDDLGFHNTSTNTARITTPANISRLLIMCACNTATKSTHTGADIVELWKNGSLLDGESGVDNPRDVQPTDTPVAQFAVPVNVASGDYFEVKFGVDYTSAVLMNITRTWFGCVVLRAT